MYGGNLPAASTRSDWIECVKLVDDETDDAIDLTGVDEITIELRNPDDGCVALSGTKTGGQISLVEDGVFQWSFAGSQMSGLTPKTYQVGITIEQGGVTVQLFAGNLPVIDGIVS